MKNLWLYVTIALLGAACHPEGRVFVEHQKLSPQIEWLKEDVKTFKVPIEIPGEYHLRLAFRYANGYQYRVALVKVTEISPSGKESVYEYELSIRDENGDYMGEPGFDIWDSEHLVEPNKTFSETGTYTYHIEHNMPRDPLHYAMEIGVILDEIE
ncbi:MAG: hypothetical protein EA392_06955 [Cryomorphaceae bacterium]|nr:MAG: hypothetical protein EA392_06955 [Cryomorphaceae bacterium]